MTLVLRLKPYSIKKHTIESFENWILADSGEEIKLLDFRETTASCHFCDIELMNGSKWCCKIWEVKRI